MADERGDLERCAAMAAREWDVTVRRIELVAHRENAVFEVVATDGRRYAMRIHRPGYHSLAELESENEWTTALAAHGIDTPRPVPTSAGTGYATVPYGAGDVRHVGLIEWIDGESLESVLDRGEQSPVAVFAALGSLMARLHDQSAAWRPTGRFVRHRLDEEGLIGEAPWWGRFWQLDEMSAHERDVIDAARARFRQTLRDYGTDPRTFGLIHADLLPQNVLVQDGRPFVIDFDDAGFGWHQYDMAVALVTTVERPDAAELRDSMVAGYRSVRAISDDDLALLPMFIAIRELVQIAWINTRVTVEWVLPSGDRIPRDRIIAARVRRAVRSCEALGVTG